MVACDVLGFIMIAKILIVGAVLNASIQSCCESGFQVESIDVLLSRRVIAFDEEEEWRYFRAEKG